MKLVLIQDANGNEFPICDAPASLLSSRTGLINFFRLHAGRVFGGSEGKAWRICVNARELVPVCVNQLVPCRDGVGAMTGCMDYGQQLVIK